MQETWVGKVDSWMGRSSGGGHGNPLQYPCLENPMDRGVQWATVHRVSKSWTGLKQLSMHTQYFTLLCKYPNLSPESHKGLKKVV